MPARRSLFPGRRPLLVPSIWDVVVFALVIGALALIGLGGRETLAPLAVSGDPISLDPAVLPHYALRTTLRMLAAMAAGLLLALAGLPALGQVRPSEEDMFGKPAAPPSGPPGATPAAEPSYPRPGTVPPAPPPDAKLETASPQPEGFGARISRSARSSAVMRGGRIPS